MPLLLQTERTEQTSEWFLPDCAGLSAQDEAEWDFRHIALANAAYHGWIGHADHVEWVSSDDEQCGRALESRISLPDKGASAMAIELRPKANSLRVEFDALSKKWQRETRHLPQIAKAIAHPSYLRIIGMGEAAVPLLLEALRDRPAPWFTALRAITNIEPARLGDNPAQAREAWLAWGVEEGLLA
jgi:hypothetical protein